MIGGGGSTEVLMAVMAIKQYQVVGVDGQSIKLMWPRDKGWTSLDLARPP